MAIHRVITPARAIREDIYGNGSFTLSRASLKVGYYREWQNSVNWWNYLASSSLSVDSAGATHQFSDGLQIEPFGVFDWYRRIQKECLSEPIR